MARRRVPTKAEVVAAGYAAEVAEKIVEREAEAQKDEAPVFVLRAGERGHLRALMAAAGELREADQAEALRVLREFELYEDRER